MNKTLSPVIGFEIHAELGTHSKMFCACSADHFGKMPNSLTCPVCLGLPGALPVPNKKAIEWTMMIGLALNCQIAKVSKFDRKHYFYPDLPKGYQISQYDEPLCVEGYLDTKEGRVGIERVHLEEDTGKLQHTTIDDKSVSLVDFNRSGVALVEIVTKPDIHSTTQALEYAKKLRQILVNLGVSDCDMEKGSMRLEANISLGLDLGYKVEVKNVNSFRYIGKAIEYELDRQKKLLESGETPAQETRGWHEKSNTTRSQRTKETAADYRYFPEPDIPPIVISEEWLNEIKSGMRELPESIFDRWVEKYGLREDYAKIGISSQILTTRIEEILQKKDVLDFDINKVIGLIVNKLVGEKATLSEILEKINSASSEKTTDEKALGEMINRAIADLPKPAEDYRNGIDKAAAALIGRVMSESKGKADGKLVAALLQKKLRG